jgi:hypothetical protein
MQQRKAYCCGTFTDPSFLSKVTQCFEVKTVKSPGPVKVILGGVGDVVTGVINGVGGIAGSAFA